MRDWIAERCRALGFHQVGIAPADCERRYDEYLAWIEAGMHGEMAYMARPDLAEARRSSEAIARGAQSIVCVALAYGHDDPPPADDEPRGVVAKYARGRDYHHLFKERLAVLANELAAKLGSDVAARAITDSAPLLERAVAERAGLGFVGKNTMLITPGLGSYTLLGELLIGTEIAPSEPASLEGRCGECRLCLDACPTSAFPQSFVLDANRCISYLTIEHRGEIDPQLRPSIGNLVFGCDICQDVCPYNTVAPSRHAPDPELTSSDIDVARPKLAELLALRSSGWKRLAGSRAIKRATRRGLIRNAAVAAGNVGDARLISPLAACLSNDSEMVVSHAAWALEQIAASARAARSSRRDSVSVTCRDYQESDWPALCEIHDLARILELAASGLVRAFLTLEMTAKPEGLFDGTVRVASVGDEVVGFVAMVDAEVSWLYVHPARHRRGIGRTLLGDAISQIERVRPNEAIEISVLAENASAIALYEACGFHEVSRKSGKLAGNEAFPAHGLCLVREPR